MEGEEKKEEERIAEQEQEELVEATEEGEEVEEKAEEVVAEEAVEVAEKKEELPAPAEEEAKPPIREERAEEEEIVEERVYTIPLGKVWIAPPNRRATRAVRMIRDFVVKHMKLEVRGGEEGEKEEPKRLIISNEVNERVWRQGIEKPPRNIRVRVAKDKEGNVTVYLAEGD